MLRFIIFLSLLLCVKGDTGRIPRIINGDPALIKDHPHTVSLQDSGSHACGGSIISAEWILTAGHCARNPRGKLTVRAGSSFSNRGGEVYDVDYTVVHDGFGKSGNKVIINDVALVHLAKSLSFDETKKPISLFEPNEETSAGTPATVVGWGDTRAVSYNQQLQKIVVPIISRQNCNKAYKKRFGPVPEGQICAGLFGKGGKDACNRDSGGPLVIAGRQAGIVSWGEGCGSALFPGVYTEVAYYHDWVRTQTGI